MGNATPGWLGTNRNGNLEVVICRAGLRAPLLVVRCQHLNVRDVMARAKSICANPGCPLVVDKRLCPEHQADAERARGSREARGYGYEHRTLRKQFERYVNAGQVYCARCRELIKPGTPWSLDHTDDRTGYLGPSHRACNDSAGGIARHRQ